MFPNTIVVPLDGSDFAANALPVARALVRQTDGRVVLVRSCWDGDAAEARAYLDEVAAAHADIDVSTVVVEDRPAPNAIRLVVRESPDRMACMTTHGRGRMRWALLGSVAEDIVRKLSGSALLVGRHCRSEWPNNFRTMVVSVDGSSAAPAVEPEAVEWANTLGLDVHVVSVVHPFDAVGPDAVLDAVVERMDAHGIHAHKCVLRNAYPGGAIADVAESLDADVIAMSSHLRTGMDRVALGSVTMGVVGMARCPVLVNRTM